mgnify:CR=1 FL=1
MITNYREKEREKKTITRNELYMDKQTLQKTNTHTHHRDIGKEIAKYLYICIYILHTISMIYLNNHNEWPTILNG